MMIKMNKGFTLIELLVVIGIIGLLTGLTTINFAQARQRARDVQRKSELSAIQKALELYKNDQNPQSYPPTGVDGLNLLVTNGYIKAVPQDPVSKAGGSWTGYSFIRSDPDVLSYKLTACLENAGDPDRTVPVVSCAGSGVIYTLTQP